MVFSSLMFLYVFLPLCVILYFLSRNITYRNIVLLIFSFVFYAWGQPKFLLLMLVSSGVNYGAGLLIDRFSEKKPKLLSLIGAAVFNIGILVYFKYAGFFLKTAGLGNLGFNPALPIGISFYTFQSLSYVVDVYKGRAKVQKSFYKLLLYIVMFPKIMSGPIVKYTDDELYLSERNTTWEDASQGVTRFCVGLAKKVLIANQCGKLVTKIFELETVDTTIMGTWFGMLMFTLQVYFDFAGYSDMAIGLGRIFGFKYKENFNYPYVSKSATEFWRRWHISLGSFFRDYVYIPLGGNRKSQWRNIAVVWLLTGLWHGASWNFIIWGVFYGCLICIEKLLKKPLSKLPKYLSPLSYVYMFFVTVFGWTVFYFTGLGKLSEALSAMLGIGNYPVTNFFVDNLILEYSLFFIIGVVFCFPFAKKLFDILKEKCRYAAIPLEILFNILAVVFSTIMLVGETYSPFLYFKF